MNYYMFNGFDKTKQEDKPTINKKKLIKVIGIVLAIILVVTIVVFYMVNEDFRNGFDKYVLRKEVKEDSLATIALSDNSNPNIYAYNKNIAILEQNVLNIYNSSGKLSESLDIVVTTPIVDVNNRFLAIAEKDGKKLYLVSEQNIVWQTDVEGNIVNVNVNKNGYVSIVIAGTSYKNVVVTYNPEGRELFRAFLGSTYAVDTDISNDNKYLAIAEAKFSGTQIQSSVKIYSIEEAQKEQSEPIVFNHIANANDMIINIKYQDKNRLVCMYDNSIHVIQDNKDNTFTEFDSQNDLFVDINLLNDIVKIVKKSSGLFSSKSQAEFMNTANGKVSSYSFDGVPKEIFTFENAIGVNNGSEALFISNSGWLIKKYVSTHEIKDIAMCGNLAAIIYKDKIELINL